MDNKAISVQTLRRLPVYLHYLKSQKGKRENISATAIAQVFGLGDVQVRKDLGSISGSGKPKTGYDVDELIAQIERYLDCGSENKSVLIGAGNLGKALMSYGGFDDFGLNVVAAFDNDESVCNDMIGDKKIYSMDMLSQICKENNIRLGIITVPASAAQGVCDTLIQLGIRAVWNFAPTILRVPEGVVVENENLASSLAILSKHLSDEGQS
jgi:redox-sensing transcriptional repressor